MWSSACYGKKTAAFLSFVMIRLTEVLGRSEVLGNEIPLEEDGRFLGDLKLARSSFEFSLSKRTSRSNFLITGVAIANVF